MFCSQCGKPNDDQANFCTSCGTALKPAAPIYTPPPPAVEEPLPDANAFYLAATGFSNNDYYLERFHRFDSQGKASPGWNWPAFFISFYWFLYRKMWGAAAWYFFLLPVSAAIVGAVAYFTDKSTVITISSIVGALYVAVVFVAIPLYANAMYYRHCRKKIADAQALTPDPRKQHSQVKTYGGTNIVAPLVILAVMFFGFFPILGIVSAIAIPAYADYSGRANTLEAADFAKRATAAVDEYYYKNGEIPDTLKQASFNEKLPPSVSNIKYDTEEPSIIVTLSKTPVKGKTLQWDATLDEKEKVVWHCHSDEIRYSLLPEFCR